MFYSTPNSIQEHKTNKGNVSSEYFKQGKFCPHLTFAHFALWPEDEFKTGLIEEFIKDYVRKLESGQIQDWANQSQIFIGRK